MKKHTMKKFLSLLMALCLCIGLGGTVFADFVITDDQITVYDGQGSDYDNYSHPMGADISGKGWRWEASSKTITLDGFQGNFSFEAVEGPLTVNLVLSEGTENNVMAVDMWTERGGPTTLAVQGKGKLSVMGNVNADVLDISEADVVVKGSVPAIVMHSGSLLAQRCELRDYPDAYYGGSISLDGDGREAFSFYAENGKTSAFAGVPATDANGNVLTFGSYKDDWGSLYQGYLNADGTPATTVCIGGGNSAEITLPSQPSSTTGFGDVAKDAYYAGAVKWAVDRGITNGTGAGTFSPDQTCTRAEIITFLWRAAGCPEPTNASAFSDVNVDAYYAKATAWAEENKMADGGTFSPDALCTREMAVEFMWRYAGTPDATEASFTDVSSDAVNWAVEAGVTNGTSDTTFSPEQTCTRAQIVTFLCRAFS